MPADCVIINAYGSAEALVSLQWFVPPGEPAYEAKIAAGDPVHYEVFEKEYDEDSKEWSTFEPEASFPTHVEVPENANLVGYDVTTFTVGTSPECSPLSCNSLATEIAVNRHCLFDTFEQAVEALEAGKFDDSEPGPFRVFAVYRLDA